MKMFHRELVYEDPRRHVSQWAPTGRGQVGAGFLLPPRVKPTLMKAVCADVIRSGRAETTPEEIKLHGLNKPHPG